MPIYGPSYYFIEQKYGGPSNGRGIVGMAYRLTEIEDDTTLACRSYPRSDVIIAAELTGWPEPRHYPRNP